MKEIQLTQGKVALVDDADFEWLNQFKWYAAYQRTGAHWYAQRRESSASSRKLLMHRVILDVDDPMLEVDHKDRNGLNNTRANLRQATRAQNQQNGILPRNNTSGYKGIYLDKRRGKWQAKIRYNGKQHYIGQFDGPEAAARAYDAAARKHFGEFARCNFPLEDTSNAEL